MVLYCDWLKTRVSYYDLISGKGHFFSSSKNLMFVNERVLIISPSLIYFCRIQFGNFYSSKNLTQENTNSTQIVP